MSDFFCSQLNNVLTFFHDKIMSCCSLEQGPIYFNNYNNEKFDFDVLTEKKRRGFEDIQKENSPCQNCFHLRQKNENDFFTEKYKELNISHWTHCNCNCTYCLRQKTKEDKVKFFKTKSRYYDLLPIIKGLYLNNLLDRENLIVRFQGGDIGVLKEFEQLVREFDKNGIMSFNFLTNNIVYQPIIAEMMKKGKASITTSLDCGTREMYKKIKNVDKFNVMINNLKKYKKECGDNAKLNVKYIVIPECNDNEKEVSLFLDLMEKLEIPSINFEIDYRFINSNSKGIVEIPPHFYDLLNLFEKHSQKNNVELDICEQIKTILKDGKYSKIKKTV